MIDKDEHIYKIGSDISWPRQVDKMKITLRQCKTVEDVKVLRVTINDIDNKRYWHTEEPNVTCEGKFDIFSIITRLTVWKDIPDENSYQFDTNGYLLQLNEFGIMDTLVFTDQFLEMNIRLDDRRLFYGIGERRGQSRCYLEYESNMKVNFFIKP